MAGVWKWMMGYKTEDATVKVKESSDLSQPVDPKVMTEPVDLPQSTEDFYRKMKSLSLLEGERKQTESYAPDVQKIIKYAGAALETGRPLNKVMIIMAGQSGAGKSTTINSLFNEDICKTSTSKSETREVTEYGKQLCVTVELPPVKGLLSFVDIPGSLDVEQSKDALNLATISEFRKKHGDLADRSGFFQKLYTVSEKVYPNLVLMIVKAGDNRMEGNDSNLMKSLKVLHTCNLIDIDLNNLIVVVTHAMSLPRKIEIYKKSCEDIVNHIREAVYAILKVRNVKIIFVENRPDDYCMEKAEGSDFYKLPDGELSHYNLIQAIVEHFKQHQDYLGRLLCGWYFADNCPEKKQKPEILHSIDHGGVSEEVMWEAKKALGNLNIGREESIAQEEMFKPFPFQYLGRGYCPITESTKNVNVYSGTETKQCIILGTTYIIPKCLQVVQKNEQHYHRLSCDTQDMYEKSKIASYGLEADIKLVVNVDSRGRWVKGNEATNNRSVVSILDEIRQTNVRMDEPENNMNKKLAAAISHLPSDYNEQTANAFSEFFSKWGSHFVCEVWLGGCVKVDYSVTASTFTEEIGGQLLNKVKSTIRAAKTMSEASLSDKSSKKEDTEDEQIIISGGVPPHVTSLEELAPEMKTWLDSINTMPTELEHSFKLCPYYNLLDIKCHCISSLRFATIDYLKRTLTDKLSVTRDGLSKQITGEVAGEKVDKNCFPPSATIFTEEGIVTLKDLKVGAKVLSLNCEPTLGLEKCRFSFTEIYAYIHYDAGMVAHFFVFHLENGKSLTVTGDHLVFTFDDGTMRAVRAKHLKIGDSLICITEMDYSSKIIKPVRIVEVSQSTIRGVYSPLTYDGKLLVDGNLVSCYANIDSHATAHACLAPLRWWYIAHKSVNTAFKYLNESLQQDLTLPSTSWPQTELIDVFNSGIHGYAKFLMFIRNFLPFKLLQD